MVHDKSWMKLKPSSIEYYLGVQSFLVMCQRVIDVKGCIFCPCKKCRNTERLKFMLVKKHLDSWGFDSAYTDWIFHGEERESVIPCRVDDAPINDMAGVIEDIMEEDTDLNEGNSGTESSGISDDFEELLKEAESELYPGCTKFSSLDFLAKLMHIKVKNRWTNCSFDELLNLLRSSYPQDNKIPASYSNAKKTLNKIGLGYESIHVCKNDCALFWKEHHSLQNCPVCNESRWVDPNTKGKKVAHKVLRYFPLTPRLRRLYCSRHTAKDMIWHSTGRSEDGTMRHPVDGSSWKEFDRKYPNFSKEPRNVRLVLAADGFNPFGNLSSAHSTWPVVLTTYNLPPWLCMKESSFMLTLLIPGPKSPGKDMDVFLRPLVDELKQLWQFGVRTKDVATGTIFTMKAALLWTINDYPARSSLSGWSGQGYLACPTCNEDTSSCPIRSKVAYTGHRRFLPDNHPMRMSLGFNGKTKTRDPPRQFSDADIQEQLSRLIHRLPGKHPDFGGVKKPREDCELNWSKRSIFFELGYWSSLQLKHNLDVMHIEKNVCDSVLGTLLMNDKSKDTKKAREDLKDMNIRKKLWMKEGGIPSKAKPHPPYSFEADERKLFCQFIKGIKLSDGFGSNISRRVTDGNTNVIGLKSHDCHILMQRLIPVGVRGLLSKDAYTPIIELCMFFKQLCSRTLLVEDMKKAKVAIVNILCQLELLYPPAFIDIMVHLVLHLPDEAIRGGPVCMRWMYPFERYMKKLKNYVRNKARPEACIAEGYVAEEALSFCSRYLRDVKTQFNCPDRNEDVIVEKTKLWVFESKCRPASATSMRQLTLTEQMNLQWFVLESCAEVRNYMDEFKYENPEADLKTRFPYWFLQKAYSMVEHIHPELYALSIGADISVSTYTACIVNGVRFMVLDRDERRKTQNSGVSVDGENGEKYYGQLEEIIELHYTNNYSTVLFRCKWFDTRRGVRCENNITSIDTRKEWDKNDQLIFASQAKQVFYIQPPPRGKQQNNPWWVVEDVNHRSTWDQPLNIQNADGNPQNADLSVEDGDRDLPEDLDIVHNSSSSGIRLSIDFSQYNVQRVETLENIEHNAGSSSFEDEADEAVDEDGDEVADEDGSDEEEFDTEESEGDTELSEGEMSEGEESE